MKMLLFAIVLSSLVVFAGPEDHFQNQKCYGLETKPGTFIGQNIPTEVCFETVTVFPANDEVVIYSYFTPQMFANTKVLSLIRNTEDTYKFDVSQMLYSQWNSGCGDGVDVTLFISGQSDFNGYSDMNQEFKVSVVEHSTNDTCHSQPQTSIYSYKLR